MQKRMQTQTAQKFDLVRSFWYEGAAEAAGRELLDKRRRIEEVTAVLRCVLENAGTIFEEEAEEEYGSGDAVSVALNALLSEAHCYARAHLKAER